MLEPLTKDDYATVLSWIATPSDHAKVCGSLFAYPLSEAQYSSYFVDNARDPDKRCCFKYIHHGATAGMASFTRIERADDYGHIGLVTIAPALRGTGIGTSLLQQLLKKGFCEFLFNRIDLVVLESNQQAYKFYTQKLGFKDEGLMRDIIKVQHNYLSWHILSLLKHEWQAQHTTPIVDNDN